MPQLICDLAARDSRIDDGGVAEKDVHLRELRYSTIKHGIDFIGVAYVDSMSVAVSRSLLDDLNSFDCTIFEYVGN